jgi:hypothetical protein
MPDLPTHKELPRDVNVALHVDLDAAAASGDAYALALGRMIQASVRVFLDKEAGPGSHCGLPEEPHQL